jgi:hypothetical protein
MPKNASINAIVTAVILLCMLVVYWFDETVPQNKTVAEGETAHPYLSYPSNMNAYWYFFTSFACILVEYSILHFVPDFGAPQAEFLHWLQHGAEVVLSNVGNISMLIAAIAYGQGKDFNVERAWRSFWICTLAIMIWAICWELADHEHNLLYTSVLIAPDVLGSDVALLLLGWVFLARWSGIGVFYFIVTIIYALLQFPANVALELCSVLGGGQIPVPCKALLDPLLFYLLASGKIALAGGFVLMLRQTTKDIDQARLWPKTPRGSPFPMSTQEISVAFLFALVAPPVLDWAWRFFTNGAN